MSDKPISQQQAQLYLDILDAIPEPILAKDAEGKFVFANRLVTSMYQCSLEDMIGKMDHDFTGDPEQSEEYTRSVKEVIAKGEIEIVQETAVDTNTGEVSSYESLKVPFTSTCGRTVVAIYAKNITDITRQKNEAERNHKRLDSILEVSGEGMWDFTLAENKVYHNRQWEIITGVDNSDNSVEEYQNCILKEDRPRVNQAINALMEDNTPYDIEYRMVRANDGEEIWIWDRGQVVERDADGKPLWVVGLIQDVTDKKINQAKIENLAFYDLLTKLPNRALLLDRLDQELENCKREKTYGAVLFADLDRFKQLNDTHGHQSGDELLIAIARRIQQTIRSSDTVARLGGDEFVVVLNDLDKDSTQAVLKAERIARQIREAIAQPVELRLSGTEGRINFMITSSIGITLFSDKTKDAKSLLRLADVALYNAKENGRDNCLVFDPDMESKVKHSILLEQQLRKAIEQKDFVLYYQPQYDGQQNMIGVEALIRWNHPEKGLVNPTDFIFVAEETNLIVPIGNWALKQACSQLHQWQQQPERAHLKLSVNISARQLWQKDFVEQIIEIIHAAKIDHNKLTLEITESVLLKDIQDTASKLEQLKAFGLHISLDDFGTGYSSLCYLKNLPIDEIKIDESFIRHILEDESDMVMVKSIISLGENFGMDVVSEGVEKLEQFESLKTLGKQVYQGHYFSEPVRAEEI